MKKTPCIIAFVSLAILAYLYLRPHYSAASDEPSTNSGLTNLRPEQIPTAIEPQSGEESKSQWVQFQRDNPIVTNKVLPALKTYLGRLASAGVSPIDPLLATNKVSLADGGSNNYVLQCRCIIDGRWVVTYTETPANEYTRRFAGITYFGETGAGNLYGAVSAGDTNGIAALAHSNSMSQSAATKLLENTLATITGHNPGNPDVFSEKYFGYDMGRWSGKWWKPGKDHWNQLNTSYLMTFRIDGPTNAVLVYYQNSAAGEK